MLRNRALPKAQQIRQEMFELDPRITEDLEKQLQLEMDLVYQKISFDLNKSRLKMKKMLEHFVEPLSCLPFAVEKIL